MADVVGEKEVLWFGMCHHKSTFGVTKKRSTLGWFILCCQISTADDIQLTKLQDSGRLETDGACVPRMHQIPFPPPLAGQISDHLCEAESRTK